MNLQQLFLDIVPDFWSSEYWKGVTQNAIGCTIGSILAIAISFFIYRLSIRHEKNEREAFEVKNRQESLQYFSELLRNIISSSKQQVSHIKDFIKKLKENSIDYPLLTFIPLYNFKRVSENNSLDKILRAYSNHYANKKNAVKNSAKLFPIAITFVQSLFICLNKSKRGKILITKGNFKFKKFLQRAVVLSVIYFWILAGPM